MQVSVVIPAHNAQKHLQEAVDSVLNQTHRDFELILIDDGSTDATLTIMREYEERDQRVRVISHPNWGIPRSLNHAIEQARNEWIARMDADDIMHPERLERQVAFVQENPDLDVTGTLVTYIDQRGREIGRCHPVGTTRDSIKETRQEGLISGIYHPTVLMRRSTVQSVGGYRPELWTAEDIDLWARIDDAGAKVLVQAEYLLQYRVHGGSSAFGKTRDVELAREWIRACSLNRRAGIAEPTLEEFLEQRNSRPLLQRLNQNRREIADACYRTAVLSYGTRDYLRLIVYVAGATILGSPHVRRQVEWRLLRPVTSRLIRTKEA